MCTMQPDEDRANNVSQMRPYDNEQFRMCKFHASHFLSLTSFCILRNL